jgi:hypothetical protein
MGLTTGFFFVATNLFTYTRICTMYVWATCGGFSDVRMHGGRLKMISVRSERFAEQISVSFLSTCECWCKVTWQKARSTTPTHMVKKACSVSDSRLELEPSRTRGWSQKVGPFGHARVSSLCVKSHPVIPEKKKLHPVNSSQTPRSYVAKLCRLWPS